MKKTAPMHTWVIGLGFGIVVLLMVSLIAFSLSSLLDIEVHIQEMVAENNNQGTLTAAMYKA